jgi:hypothetical protein
LGALTANNLVDEEIAPILQEGAKNLPQAIPALEKAIEVIGEVLKNTGEAGRKSKP